ncbi:PREDICTED: uncharacterized protein LOC108562074 [Nicrophorus vespilloides]|uniref:Uncharacterized protein LOC108562074 n=1 Tax=Nicrophorus vespilloides TaxID=110193 RepID=A0ABM1MMG8_NICVS|nr:PREDICTED: uncharacterized protein LOC108562074 [Nicrophorus vespilloides]
MNKFLVFALFVAGVAARPDIGLKLRQQGYGLPTGSYLPGTYQTQQQFVQQTSGGIPSTGYNTGAALNSYQTSGLVEQGFNQFTQGFAPARHESFFFDSPEDLGETHVRVHVQPSAAAGDKTIYIRAPAYNSKIVPHFNIAQQQAAGKTKVYVLVKKQEQQQDIVVPAAVQGPAAKPEVVFVKYSNQKEAEQKIQDIQQGASGGNSAKVVFNHRELISSIKDQPAIQQQGYYAGPSVNFVQTGIPATSISTSSGPGAFTQTAGIGAGEDTISNTITKEEVHYGPAGASGPY